MTPTKEKTFATPLDAFSILDPVARERLLRAAETDVSILLVGETGTGKGQMARAIAAASPFPQMIEVNCAALPDELLGSELFGHVRGAFTGAVRDRKGLLAESAGKTLFLDEIGEISLKMQRMLLRVVQRSHRTFKPLGSDREMLVPDLRFLFATNRNLELLVSSGEFRQDLLRRIDIVTITIPPLRTRPELIPVYAKRFLEDLSRHHRLPFREITSGAMKRLLEYSWPGNVRELKNVLERTLVTAPRENGIRIREEDLLFSSPSLEDVSFPRGAAPSEKSFPTLDQIEAQHIRKALDACGGRIPEAVRLLGLQSRSALYRRMKKYGITLERRTRNKEKGGKR
ncbi:MAG: sigma-54-dependent Fis family transcriptional regulator [Candidatus Hydrogenedentota bacterium]|nr:MAG: sigma-54-dependent Fis family transcriptional regulator [Candidatus Hydrogenedentota bacterium]